MRDPQPGDVGQVGDLVIASRSIRVAGRKWLLSLALAVSLSACSRPPAAESNAVPTTSEVPAAHTAQAPGSAPADCTVTRPPEPPFVPPSPYSKTAPFGGFWFGTESLWTDVPSDGVWPGLSYNAGSTQKIFWWRKGYSASDEPHPDLTVTAQRLDAPAPVVNGSKATNAYASDIGRAMLVGVEFPTFGCWEITGRYRGTALSFVVWVAP